MTIPTSTTSDPGFRHRQVEVGNGSVHVVEAGDPAARPVVLLHGWPECWRAWQEVMALAAPHVHAVALDLPGIGGSTGAATAGSKRELARVVHDVVGAMGLEDVTLVGHDAGGMVAYAYLRSFADLGRAVIMDVVVPGLDPWDEVLHNPWIWHFGLHAVPELPERLVQGRQADYFGYFYDAIAADPRRIAPEAREAHAAAYATDEALTAGFDWYRAFAQDAADNQGDDPDTTTPLLYLRGDHEGGDIDRYTRALTGAGVTSVQSGIVVDAGHFAPEEAPAATWDLISAFLDG